MTRLTGLDGLGSFSDVNDLDIPEPLASHKLPLFCGAEVYSDGMPEERKNDKASTYTRCQRSPSALFLNGHGPRQVKMNFIHYQEVSTKTACSFRSPLLNIFKTRRLHSPRICPTILILTAYNIRYVLLPIASSPQYPTHTHIPSASL